MLWPDRDVAYVSLPEDAEGYHFGAFLPSQNHEAPVAIISLFLAPVPRGEVDSSPSNFKGHAARFRKFACHPDYRRRTFFLNLNYVSTLTFICSRRNRNEIVGTCLFGGIYKFGSHIGMV